MTYNDDSLRRSHAAAAKLTVGERACLEFVGARLGSKEIARKLNISPHTVDARLKSACAKLGTNSRFVAAQMLAADEVTVTSSHTNLVYGSPGLPNIAGASEKGSSAGEGDGPDELAPSLLFHEHDGRERDHPLAKFARKQKNLSIVRQTILMICIAMLGLFAFGALVNGLSGLSKVLSSP